MEHKCNNCGAEFQGNFCPNCGAKYEEATKVCPDCGTTLNAAARFCHNCGHAFTNAAAQPAPLQSTEQPLPDVTQPAPKPKKQRDPQKVRAVFLKLVLWLPAAYAVLLGALTFAFMAAPAVSLLGFGQSFYSALKDATMASYKLPAIFAMAFAGVSIAVGVVLLVFAKKDKHTPLLSLCLALAAYSSLFVISCVAMSQATHDGMQAGAASILILTFTILGVAISVASFVIDCNLTGKTYSLPKITVNLNKAIKAFWIIPQILLVVFCVAVVVSCTRKYYWEIAYGNGQIEHGYTTTLLEKFIFIIQRLSTSNGEIYNRKLATVVGVIIVLCTAVASLVYLIFRIRTTVRLLRGRSTSVPQKDAWAYLMIYAVSFVSVSLISYCIWRSFDYERFYISFIKSIITPFTICFLLTVASFFLLALCQKARERNTENVAVHTPKQRTPVEGTVWQKILCFTPAACTIVFALLVFAFMAAPIYDMLGFGENYYAVFNKMSTTGDYMLITAFTMLFALVGIIYGLFALKRCRRQLKLPDFVVMLALCLAHLVLAAVTMGRVKKQMLNVGTGPILILVFAVLFMAGIAVCLGFEWKKKGFAALKPDPIVFSPRTVRFVNLAPMVLILLVNFLAVAVCCIGSSIGGYGWLFCACMIVVCIICLDNFVLHSGYYASVAFNSRKRIAPTEIIFGILSYLIILGGFGAVAFVKELQEELQYEGFGSLVILCLIVFAIAAACAVLSVICAFLHLKAKKQYVAQSEQPTVDACDSAQQNSDLSAIEQESFTDDQSNGI